MHIITLKFVGKVAKYRVRFAIGRLFKLDGSSIFPLPKHGGNTGFPRPQFHPAKPVGDHGVMLRVAISHEGADLWTA